MDSFKNSFESSKWMGERLGTSESGENSFGSGIMLSSQKSLIRMSAAIKTHSKKSNLTQKI